MENKPPRWAQQFLAWYCNPHLLEDIEGDLHELFNERVEKEGLKKARLLYIWDVFRCLKPYSLKRKQTHSSPSLYMDMLGNYFTIALRSFRRNKVYSFLNVIGLSAGITVSLLILLFVQHEWSYDKFHLHAEQIYKVDGKFNYAGEDMYFGGGLSAAVAPHIKQLHSEVASFVRMSGSYDHILTGRKDDPSKRFYEDKWVFVDSTFLSVFSFQLLSGNRPTALTQPNTLLITPAAAKKYFGDEDPVGKTLFFFPNPNPYHDSVLVLHEYPFTITGIIEPTPSNSSVQYNFVASFESLATINKQQFKYDKLASGAYQTFFLLESNQAAQEVRKSLNSLIPPMLEGMKQQFFLEPLPDLHLHGQTSSSNLKYVYIFLGVALLILLLALINYISLTTARATKRAKEVGIRKVIGAKRRQLMVQFFGESILIIFISFMIACLAILVSLRPFYGLIDVQIPIHFLLQPQFVWIICCVLMVTAIIAGSYPALLLSGFAPTAVLKGKFSSERGGALLRRIFTVFQFSASIFLIICSLVMQNQLDWLRNKDIGLDKEQLLIIPIEATIGNKYQALKNQIRQQSGVQQVAASTGVPFKAEGTNMMLGETPDKRQINLYFNNIDEDFLSTFHIAWKQKLNEADIFSGGAKKVIINETAAKKLGLSPNPLGQMIPFGGEKLQIAGVVRDFNYLSLQTDISPLVLFPIKDTMARMMNYGGYLTVRLAATANTQEKVAAFERIYKNYNENKPFEYFFLDETFDQLYKYQDRLANISNVFTGFAILISCLGLFGLAAFTAEQRTKEIGIRKVLGASIGSIISLLSKEFIRLVLLAFLIAVPVAWYAMHQWLQEFAYRIPLSWWLFALAGGLALLIACITVSFQSVKAASANPVKSLRNE